MRKKDPYPWERPQKRDGKMTRIPNNPQTTVLKVLPLFSRSSTKTSTTRNRIRKIRYYMVSGILLKTRSQLKKMDPDTELRSTDPRSRIRNSYLRIQNTGETISLHSPFVIGNFVRVVSTPFIQNCWTLEPMSGEGGGGYIGKWWASTACLAV